MTCEPPPPGLVSLGGGGGGGGGGGSWHITRGFRNGFGHVSVSKTKRGGGNKKIARGHISNEEDISNILIQHFAIETSKSSRQKGRVLKRKLFLIIAQLCPNIEYLDLSNNHMLSFISIKHVKDC